MDFNFHMPVHVVSGEGAVARNSTLLRTLGRRCLIITGGSSAKRSGALADVTAALDLWEIGWAVYDAVGPNPLVSACHEAGVVARSVRAEFIIGIGGGSPLDAAKAAAIFAANEELAPMDIFQREGANPPLPLALVGTTAGTGSEVSPVAVLTIDESGRKKRHIRRRLLCAHCLCRPYLYAQRTIQRNGFHSPGCPCPCNGGLV